ncbi:hypothetical protein P4O66_008111 [Electrophorus voltai]|uniref:Uncharacterized protein n=1 Tax=Electrophorus voltai TaxID=2609070 RepID=A0AAD9DW79_9TELE|nr:hypothetical protein P4O66_008111 [Electrophorus voltai]
MHGTSFGPSCALLRPGACLSSTHSGQIVSEILTLGDCEWSRLCQGSTRFTPKPEGKASSPTTTDEFPPAVKLLAFSREPRSRDGESDDTVPADLSELTEAISFTAGLLFQWKYAQWLTYVIATGCPGDQVSAGSSAAALRAVPLTPPHWQCTALAAHSTGRTGDFRAGVVYHNFAYHIVSNWLPWLSTVSQWASAGLALFSPSRGHSESLAELTPAPGHCSQSLVFSSPHAPAG